MAKQQPNIVFFFCDDLGWGDVSCLNPESRIHTPNIDALSASGITFTDAHAGSAMCTPSRYSLLTGRYCWRTRLKQYVSGGYSPALISPERQTVASLLKGVGYRTACMGKWHLGMNWSLKPDAGDTHPPLQFARNESRFDWLVDFSKPVRNGPTDVGFEYFFGISASLDMSPYVFIENDRVQETPTSISPAGEAELRAREGIASEGWKHENVLPTITSKAVDFVERSATDGVPFFLYVPVNSPHTPVVPNRPWIGRSSCGIYGDFVMETDDCVRRIVEALERTGVRENTAFFFSSDNGPETLTAAYREMYSHYSAWKFRGMKRDNWEGGHRIPYIVSWPAVIEPGTRNDRFVELVDFFATAAALAGARIGDYAGQDSFDMSPLLVGSDAEAYRSYSIHHSGNGKWAIRQGKWKLLLHSGSGGNEYDCPENNDPVQLYDMEADPFETTNIYATNLEVVRELRAICLDCIQRGRTTPGPDLENDPDGEWHQLTELIELEL